MRHILFICLAALTAIIPSCNDAVENIALKEQHRKDSLRIDSFTSRAIADKIHLQELTDSITAIVTTKKSGKKGTHATVQTTDVSEAELAKEVVSVVDLIKQKVAPAGNDNVHYISWDFGKFSLTQYPDSTVTLQMESADGAYIVDENANGLNVSDEDSYGKSLYAERDASSQAAARANYLAAVRSLKTELRKQ